MQRCPALRSLILFLVCGIAVAMSGPPRAAEVFPQQTEWKYLKGTREASSPDTTAWRTLGFDDTAWDSGLAPFVYGEDLTGYFPDNPGTALNDMRGNYSCVFLRKTFVIKNPAGVSTLELKAVSDDGFIAWINGREVARYNMPEGVIPYNGLASGALAEPIPLETHVVDSPQTTLVAGTNILAVQGFNNSLGGSSDFVFFASLTSSADEIPPVIAYVTPEDLSVVRALYQIEVGFSEPVTGVEAADLLVNGVPATNLVTLAPGQYRFEFPSPAPGPVAVTWRPDHGITDLATSPNPFVASGWHYTLNPQATVEGVYISEFMADNSKTLHDEDGDSSDWIEIYNSTTRAVDLNGWFLTDRASTPARWRFPAVSLASKAYLVVFASGKDRKLIPGTLHTNFKLERSGGYLGLYDDGTNLVSNFGQTYPIQSKDVSYGRDRLAPDMTLYFPTPTPGAANATGGPGFAPEVAFSVQSATFSQPFTLVLSTANTNATIRYTLNGAAPTNTSTLYTGPIQIATAVQVRARAFQQGLLPGSPHSENYLYLASTVLNRTSNLPQVIIHNFGAGNIPADGEQYAAFAVFEPKNGVSSLTNAPDLISRSRVNIRGSSTLGLPKSSFSLEFWDEFNDDANRPLLGMPAESDWVLYAPDAFEPVMIHNPFMHDLSRQIGRYSPRVRFAEVYVNKAGGAVSSANYFGIYVIEEKIKRGSDRVDIAALEPEHTTPPKVTGGYMLKIDRLDPGDGGLYAADQSMAYVYPREETLRQPAWSAQQQYIANYMNQFGAALNGAKYKDPALGYRAYVDVDSWVDHHILNVLSFNVDALRLSAYFYKPREGKLTFGPLWDFDRALGSTDGRDANPRVWRSTVSDLGTDFFNYPWWGRMFTDIDFHQRWVDRYQELRTDALSLTNMYRLIDELTDQLRQAQPREQAKWGVAPRGGSYNSEIAYMKTWLSNRVDFMDTNFVRPPKFTTPPGRVASGTFVTFTGVPGAVPYYTTDGTDPRLPGGDLNPKAQPFAGGTVVRSNVRIVVRNLNSAFRGLTGANNPPLTSPWSGPVAATYYIEPPPLVVTELMYHPAPDPTAPDADPDLFEFIELANVGNTNLSLPGFALTNGVHYTFTASSGVTNLAPGAHVVLVKNLASFQKRYPAVTNIAGEYTGSLDNGGERIFLEGPLKEPILDFTYAPEWAPASDGLGFSLTIANPHAPLATWGNPESWRLSSRPGGSPGTSDPEPTAEPQVKINEALTHTDLPAVDAIELFNPGPTPANVGGWYLTDNFNEPAKYRIAPGTTIAPGGFLVLTEADFNTGAPGSFSLSSLGEEVYLFAADEAGLTGYYHGFMFGAAANGVSFGRHVISTGAEHFVAQSKTTLGATNAPPLVGPLVIGEIFYQPPLTGTNALDNTLDEFLELRNVTTATVPLFDPALHENGWHLRGGVSFDFASPSEVRPGGYLLLVNFATTNSTLVDAFRAKYAVAPAIPILGPYEGKLGNTGDSIRLLRPDAPEPTNAPNAGEVPYVLVDRVDYSSLAPWPKDAAGTGKSIQRVSPQAYGNDPANWSAAQPTPGGPALNEPGDTTDTDGDGLPDAWERAHGLDPLSAAGNDGANGDPDGDGMSNLAEFLAGTDPRDASSALRLVLDSVSHGQPSLRFHAVAGHSYTVLVTDGFGTDPDTGTLVLSWKRLQDVSAPAPGEDKDVVVVDTSAQGTDSARFYKVVTPVLTAP